MLCITPAPALAHKALALAHKGLLWTLYECESFMEGIALINKSAQSLLCK